MKQYDVVSVTKDNPLEGITKGQIGTILEVFDENNFEVELCDNNGKTLFLGTLSKEFLSVIV